MLKQQCLRTEALLAGLKLNRTQALGVSDRCDLPCGRGGHGVSSGVPARGAVYGPPWGSAFRIHRSNGALDLGLGLGLKDCTVRSGTVWLLRASRVLPT